MKWTFQKMEVLAKTVNSFQPLTIFAKSLNILSHVSHPAFTYSKLTIETLEQSVKYVQS